MNFNLAISLPSWESDSDLKPAKQMIQEGDVQSAAFGVQLAHMELKRAGADIQLIKKLSDLEESVSLIIHKKPLQRKANILLNAALSAIERTKTNQESEKFVNLHTVSLLICFSFYFK